MIRRHLTYANVTATLALVLAAGTGAVYAAGEIGSREVANNSIRTQDLKDRRGVTGEDVRRNSLGRSEIAEENLDGGRIVDLIGDDDLGVCDPQDSTFMDCASLSINLDAPSKLLVVATGGFYAEGTGADLECEVRVDGVDQAVAANPGEVTDNTDGSATDGFARTLVTSQLPAGPHTVALACQQIGSADGRVDSPTIAAIVVRD